MNEKELEILIPSKTVRDYVVETGWRVPSRRIFL